MVLLSALLSDSLTVRAPYLQQQAVVPLEALITTGSELACVPNLLRCLNSSAAAIFGKLSWHLNQPSR